MQKKVALAPLCLKGRLLEVIQLEAIEPWAYTACLKKRGKKVWGQCSQEELISP